MDEIGQKKLLCLDGGEFLLTRALFLFMVMFFSPISVVCGLEKFKNAGRKAMVSPLNYRT